MFHRFRCVIGHSGNNCGAAALASVARHHGIKISLAQTLQLMEGDLQGVSLPEMAQAAEKLGFETAIGSAKADLLHKLPLPAIALLDDGTCGHYVVIHQLFKSSVRIADPAIGLYTIPIKSLVDKWGPRYLLLLRPKNHCTIQLRKTHGLIDLLHLIATDAKNAIWATLLGFVSSAFGFVIAYSIRIIIDRAIPTSNRSLVAILGYGALAMVGGKVTGVAARQRFLDIFGQGLEYRLRIKYIDRLIRMPVKFFADHFMGDLFNRFANVLLIRSAIVGTVLSLVIDISFVVGCIVALSIYSPLLTAIAVGSIPLAAAIAWSFADGMMMNERRYRAADNDVSSTFISLLENIRLIKAYASENEMVNGVASAIRRAHAVMSECDRQRRCVEACSNLVMSAFTVALLWVGAYLVLERSLTVGTMMFYLSLSGLLLGSADRILPSSPSVQKAIASFECLDEIFAADVETSGRIVVGNNTSKDGSEIQTIGLNFCYRKGTPVLDDLSLHILPGETIAIVGETGCGKTTLANLLVGLETATSGQILIDGIAMESVDKRSLRQKISLIFQESGLLNTTILENITMGQTSHSLKEVIAACELTLADEFIKDLPRQYYSPVGSSGITLSSGQRQRIALARAVLRNPAVLILDESTANLDPETERRVLQNMMAAGVRRTHILITHRLTTARHAERILVMNRGRIVEAGTHEDLVLSNGRYSLMWSAFAGGTGLGLRGPQVGNTVLGEAV